MSQLFAIPGVVRILSARDKVVNDPGGTASGFQWNLLGGFLEALKREFREVREGYLVGAKI